MSGYSSSTALEHWDAGPLRLGERTRHRLTALLVLVPALVVLGLAGWLEPASGGTGTHTQLGLAPCMFKASTGLPCVSCGMTTAFAHAANGDLLTAFQVQPAAAIFAVATAAMVWIGGYAAVTGLSLQPLAQKLARPQMLVVLFALLLAAWAYTLSLHIGT